MNIVRALPRALAAFVCVVAPALLSGQAAGATKDKMADKMDKPMDKMDKMDKMNGMHVSMGTFTGTADHMAAGSYSIGNANRKMTLTTSDDFASDPQAPDVYLVLAKGSAISRENGLWLGKLKKVAGAYSVVIPANAALDGYDTVVLWCKQCNVLMGSAPLDNAAIIKARMNDGMKDGMKDNAPDTK